MSPEKAFDHIRLNAKPTTLTFAAEIAGQCQDSAKVRAALWPLLFHTSRLVREGAIYGISNHRDSEINERLRSIASSDESPGVRSAAKEALDG